MLELIKKIFGTKNDRDLKSLYPIVRKINALEAQIQKLSDEELKDQTNRLRQRYQKGETLDQLLPEAFATIREASKRVLGMRHFDVQLMGGIVLFQGKISEMKTGEGKTLTATLPLYLHGISQKGAHLVTVNDYLASRDAKEMGHLFNWLGLSVGVILNEMSDEERQSAYAADITYGTNNEFAFDYLRDNMKFSLESYVQRGHNFCIVDEVDSILIDEARTPLLISGPSEGKSELYQMANEVIPKLAKDQHYTVDLKQRAAMLTDDGVVYVQELLKLNNLFDIENTNILHHLHQALKAHALFAKNVDYVVKDGQVIIVDEFTGRLKTGSRWSDGLHQAVEAKEHVRIKPENQTLASITFQNYFKLYKRLAGMTGTADTEAEEFGKIYSLEVVVIPTNLPMVRKDEADVIYKTTDVKFKAVAKLIEELHHKGQPVLVGTISIDNSEKLSQYLNEKNIPHEVLNAKQHEREAMIIQDAGKKGAVTIATNMAGRGTDIKLPKDCLELGGLYIVGTERHEARRIDNQLRGRSGRQGDPGHSKFFLSLEDDLMKIFGSQRLSKIMTTLGMKDDEPIEHRMITNAIAKAQKKVEGHNFEIRKHLLKYDNVMNEQRTVIYRLRRSILGDEDNWGLLNQMVEDVAFEVLDPFRPAQKTPIEGWDWPGISEAFQKTFNTKTELSAQECLTRFEGDAHQYLGSLARDGLTERFKAHGQEDVKPAIRELLLSILDHEWKDHLLRMDHLKEGIGLRAYAQKDPLIEYKKEGFALFETMRLLVKKAITQKVMHSKLYTQKELEEIKREQEEYLAAQLEAHRKAQEDLLKKQEEEEEKAKRLTRPIRQMPKVGRNDVCPCGSGKKFKQCHGA